MGIGCLSTSFFLLLSFFFPCVFWWHWQQQLECLCLCPALSMEDERTDGRRETGSDRGEAPDWSHRLVVATAATTTTTTDQMKARYLPPSSTVCVSHRLAGAFLFHGAARHCTARVPNSLNFPSARPPVRPFGYWEISFDLTCRRSPLNSPTVAIVLFLLFHLK